MFELSVLQYEGNYIAYAHFIPNPLCSAWRVFGSETQAKAQVVVWQNQIDGAMAEVEA